jgi:7-cyano-7-deazaguanine reductase
VPNQPDYGKKVELIYVPDESIIELKSLKLYFQQFREHVFSYEHLINIIFDDIMLIYEPRKLKVVMETYVRGGIYSVLEVDSERR